MKKFGERGDRPIYWNGEWMNDMYEDALQLLDKNKIDLVKKLISKKVSNVKYQGNKFQCFFDGKLLKYEVKVNPHNKFIGNWSKKHNRIFIDDDIFRSSDKNEILCLLVHEAVEKYVTENYGLREDIEAHFVAEVVERKFAKEVGVDWEKYDFFTDMINRVEKYG